MNTTKRPRMNAHSPGIATKIGHRRGAQRWRRQTPQFQKHGRRRAARNQVDWDRLPTAEQFYSAEILEYRQFGERKLAVGLCPFHPDGHPSFLMMLKSGGYKCLA